MEPPEKVILKTSKNLRKGFCSKFEIFLRQTLALTEKNLILAYRNTYSTLTQLFIGAVFLILLLLIGEAIRASSKSDTTFIDQKTHEDRNPFSIFPNCTAGSSGVCYSFAYASSRGELYRNDTAIEELVDAIARKLNINPERNASSGIFAFGPSTQLSDNGIADWVIDNPNKTRAVVIFENSHQWRTDPSSAFRFIYSANSSRICKEIQIYKCDEPWLTYHVPLISAINSAFISLYGGNESFQIQASFSNFPHPANPTAFDAMQQFGSLFVYIAFTFNYVILLTNVVREKELHLVESMRQMGMMDISYWISWVLSSTVTNTIMVFILMLFGTILQFDLFLKTAPELLIVILWLSAQAFTAIALFFSSFIRTTGTARAIGGIIFVFTFVGAPLLYIAYYLDGSEGYNMNRWAIALFPFFAFYHPLQTAIDKSAGTLNDGMSWEERSDNLLPQNPRNLQATFWSVESSLYWLLSSFFIWIFLAWYVEKIVPNEHGRYQNPLFIIDPKYWGFFQDDIDTKSIPKPDLDDKNVDEDVKKEADDIFEKKTSPAVVLRGVEKTFGWRHPFTAVNRVFYGMDYGQLTAILGHNGSGKSTTINMLTGLSSLTNGYAEIFGHSVSKDMSVLFANMGVCPQHDVLWEQLSAREHLRLFGRIKGIEEDVMEEAQKRIDQVKLTSSADVPVGGFSGGMKRRLSIALAMLGDPAIVFLDEPTTGMDPVTRRDVLEMISNSKRPDRVIVLTSHAMEEVEILADKVVVMSHGRIQAVGSVIRLKKKFGTGYFMTMFGASVESIQNYLKTHLEGNFKVELDPYNAVLVKLPADLSPQQLIPFFAQFEADKQSLGVKDYSLSLSSLEDVFLNLSKAEEEGHEIALVTESNEQVYQKMDEESSSSNNARKIPVAAQLNALFWKSLVFQLKNWTGCCCTIMFPAVVMFAMIALNSLLFEPNKVLALCGQNVAAADCAKLGPDLQCLADLYERRPIVTLNAMEVGVIDRAGRFSRRISVNPNCNRQGCYTGLEKMDSRRFGVSAVDTTTMDTLGTVNFTGPFAQQLFQAHADMIGLLDINKIQCDGAFLSGFGGCPRLPVSANLACLQDRAALLAAQNYLDSITPQQHPNEAGLISPISTFSCVRNSDGSGLAVPNQTYIDRLTQMRLNRANCQASTRVSRLAPLLANSNLNSLLSTQANVGQPGMMKNAFSTASVLGKEFSFFTQEVWQAVDLLGPTVFGNQSNYNLFRNAWFDSVGVDPTDLTFVPTIKDMCSANVGQFVFKTQLSLVIGVNQTLTNFCALFSNLDKFRGTSTILHPDREALDKAIYKSWYGEQFQDSFLESLYGNLSYRTRQYYSQYSALHVSSNTESNFSFVIYHNKTANVSDKTTNWVQLVHLVESAIVRSKINRNVEMRSQEMPTKYKCNRDEWLNGTASLVCDSLPSSLKLSVLDFVALQLFPFLFFTYCFLVVNQIVYEKEQKLRVIMKMNGGLSSSIYWFMGFAFFYFQFLLMCTFIYVLGSAAKLNFTSLHAPEVYWAFAVSWGALLVSFSFLLSIIFASSQTATAGVFLFVLIVNVVGIQLINNLILDPTSTESSYSSLMWLPPFIMIRYVAWMSLAGQFGESIDSLKNFADGDLVNCIIFMWIEFVVCSFLVWYLDNVYVASFGTRKHPLFCLQRSYWGGGRRGKKEERETDEEEYPIDTSLQFHSINNPDVVAEYERVRQPKIGSNNSNILLRVIRLHKRFENGFVAVKSLSLGVNKNECFGLLGHNGAGKSTAISILVGLFEPTSGTAYVDNLSILHDMDYIQSKMGICMQHDICWGSLSVKDHLLFYARLKGVPPTKLNSAINQALHDVNLKRFENRRADKLSGGMRRRLSTAMSLVGNPNIVYLDEPSTGLDPASKRALWNVIAKAKGNKSIVLTTHSLEEAEVLCDRLGIMALGELQCIGTSTELKQRYGIGYSFFIATKRQEIHHDEILELVYQLFGSTNIRLLNKPIGGAYKFEVKREAVVLSKVFAMMETREIQEKLEITDYALTETSLEEVFLKLADMAHVNETLLTKREKEGHNYLWCCNNRKQKQEGELKEEKENAIVVAAAAEEDKV